ncbi:RNA degradosome polyphosphate kinase [Sutcliffiella halmapala]|uniref:RNA degradosome polyphosphate kinase n=1 Tax=Sutcliffiella halmapala TaxID=79882 RepID=UPI000994B100|nr:RNA degradosome polyphosphate kinase [Sutcliffiella halmapala]
MEVTNLKKIELNDPSYYNNRELSWLAFNKRVLEEAIDVTNPLLERFKFLGIFSSNLDEFFMVRVAGIKDQVKAGFNKPENKAGLTPKEQLSKISHETHGLVQLLYQTFQELTEELNVEKVVFQTMESLTSKQKKYVEDYFDEQIFPVLTPLAVDAYRPFPMLLNKSINLAITLESVEETVENKIKRAIVQVPSVLERFIELPELENKYSYIMLEEVITSYIYKLFRGYQVLAITQFRITRNADMNIHEEGSRDLLKEIEKELKRRKWGAAVRLEVRSGQMEPDILTYLMQELEVHSKDIYVVDGPLDPTYLFSLYKKLSSIKDHLIFETLIPQPSKQLGFQENIFEKLLEEDILLHHPYESFEPVIDFVRDAADDPDVLAIKQTLYRVSGGSPVIEALKRSAENGKQVTVLVELKARFDEENNVQWARELEKAGCHVIYGMTSLKTHSKITLVVRRKDKKIERFVHLGTGNYNDATAKVYTDIGLLTANRKIGIDATNFFNYLSGYTQKPSFYHFCVAPLDIREKFISLIDKEIQFHRKYGNGKIIAKMNALTDKSLIMKLYEASSAGVKIHLIVRGICCLRPGLTGVSENIRVRSIVGRFLEHSRVYYFYQNGKEKIYLSSADMMTRNMEKRVEILFPVFSGRLKKRLKHVIAMELSDNVKAREQNEAGEYYYVKVESTEAKLNCQLALFQLAYHVKEDEE